MTGSVVRSLQLSSCPRMWSWSGCQALSQAMPSIGLRKQQMFTLNKGTTPFCCLQYCLPDISVPENKLVIKRLLDELGTSSGN